MGFFWIEVVIGFVVVVVSIMVVCCVFFNKDYVFWWMGLVVVVFIYVVFFFFSGSLQWVLIEVGGVLFYLSFVVLFKCYSLWYLVLGWGFYVLWDLLLYGEDLDFVFFWYFVVCLGFDVVIVVYVIWLWRECLVLKEEKFVLV